MHQIFVSYARDDEAFVTRLVDDLTRTGANIWLDIRNARPGRHWARSIEHALSESAMMIVVLSPAALRAPHVPAGWHAYLEAYRPVIPVLAAPCDLPGPLRTRRPIDFTREQAYNQAFQHLTERLLDFGARVRRSNPVIWELADAPMPWDVEYTPPPPPARQPPALVHPEPAYAGTGVRQRHGALLVAPVKADSDNNMQRIIRKLQGLLRRNWT